MSDITNAGKLIICGPFTEGDSAFLLLSAENQKEANNLVEQDPFVKSGYYSCVEIKELIEANEHNNWLM